jgi:predicted NBD/HSP70 family sugar kinase
VGVTSASLREQNLTRALQLLHGTGEVSRAELTRALGVSRATAGVLVSDLLEAGLIEEHAGQRSGPHGRPSPRLVPAGTGYAAVAVELAVTSTRVTTVRLGGTTTNIVDVRAATSPASAARQIAGLIDAQMEAHPGTYTGVGVAVYGTVAHDTGVVERVPNLGWAGVPLGPMISGRLRHEAPVVLANAAELGALSEARRGAGRGARHVLHVMSGVGVGGAVTVDGDLVRTPSGGGEVGHMVVNPAGARCGCGATGCWETEVDGRALLRHAGLPVDDDEADAVGRLLAAAADGARWALDAVDEVAPWLGLGIANLVNILAPDRIVLGGHFAGLYPFVADTVAAHVARRALTARGAHTEIVPGALASRAALLGAGELGLGPVLDARAHHASAGPRGLPG